MESEWLLEKGSRYSLGDDWIGSDIFVDIEGEMAEICSVHLVLTQRDHLQLREIEEERDKAIKSALHNDKKHWWQKATKNKQDNERAWRESQEKYIRDREDVYRRPKILHDKYLSIILSAQSAVDLLKEYRDTGAVDTDRLERVLSIADGEIAPMFQYAGQVCSCGHKDTSHETEYNWYEHGAGCTENSCDCKRFTHATDIVGEIKTVNIRELRNKSQDNSE